MIILVCGGRDYMDKGCVYKELNAYEANQTISRIITGGANGADDLAAQWAMRNEVDLDEYHAKWGKYGKAAGPIRNARMLEEGKPDIVIAFPGGKGTADMVRKSKKAGIEVIEVQ